MAGKSGAIVRVPKVRRGVRTPHSLDRRIAAISSQYFGIDLANLHQMSDEDLSKYADTAREAREFAKSLPILEKHFDEIIESQQAYEAFLAKLEEKISKSAKVIDKEKLKAFMSGEEYAHHLDLMVDRADQQKQLLDRRTESEAGLMASDFHTALKLIAIQHERKAQQIQQKIPDWHAKQQVVQQQRQAQANRVNLLKKGQQGNSSNHTPRKGKSNIFSSFFNHVRES